MKQKKYKGHYNQFFNCLSCNKKTDIMLDNCTCCGSRTPVDQKDYRRMRTRKLNAILISKARKNLEILDDLIKGSKGYLDPEFKFTKHTVWDDIKFKISLYKGLIKHKLDLY